LAIFTKISLFFQNQLIFCLKESGKTNPPNI